METLHFGLHIAKNDKFDALQDIAARLFICPRISPEHATRMLDMLVNGKLSIESFIDRTDTYIEELSRRKEIGDDIPYIMNNKLDAWCKFFNTPSTKDYEYLETTFGFSKDDLFGNLANETVKETTKDRMTSAKSAKELASFVKQYIKGQDEAIDKLAIQFFLHLDSKRNMFDGCYQGIEGIVKRRLNIGRTIGFSQPQKDLYDGVNLQTLIKVEDLQEWGYSQELTGRIGNVVVINPLTTDAIYAIMTSAKDNILQSHIDTFSQSNIDLKFSEDALLYIANEAHKSGLGFRNVKALLAAALNRLYFDMPECAGSEKKLVISISKDYVMQNINVKQL